MGLFRHRPSEGLAKPSNLPKNWRIWWFGWACVAQPSLGRWRNTLISELTERFYAPVFMEAFSCGCSNFSKYVIFTGSEGGTSNSKILTQTQISGNSTRITRSPSLYMCEVISKTYLHAHSNSCHSIHLAFDPRTNLIRFVSELSTKGLVILLFTQFIFQSLITLWYQGFDLSPLGFDVL